VSSLECRREQTVSKIEGLYYDAFVSLPFQWKVLQYFCIIKVFSEDLRGGIFQYFVVLSQDRNGKPRPITVTVY
jgi:hypothetical protein